MGFKTNRKTGNVFNDNKQRSDKHHGSVKPQTGMKIKGKDVRFYGTPIGEYNLDDILQEANFKNIEQVTKENIIFTLKREKKWGENYNIVFPAGSLKEFREDNKDEGGFYQFDFAVFDNPNHVKYGGTAYGSISDNTMLDMTVELYQSESEKRNTE